MLSFYRSLWIGVGVAFVLLLIVARGADRRRVIQWMMVGAVVAMVVLGLSFSQPESRGSAFVIATWERLASLSSEETIAGRKETSTLRWRDFEYTYAMPHIMAHPLTGIGLGADYRPFLPDIDYEGFDGQGFTHNAHIWILLKTGLLGYACLLGFLLMAIARGFQRWRQVAERQLQAVVLGLSLILVGILISAITEPLLMQWEWIAVIGTALGINESILRHHVRDIAYEA